MSSANETQYSTRYRYYVLGVLFFVYVFNFVDRYILSILVDPIKAELGVSDTAMGFLTGFAFAVFYTTAGIPIARWADHGPRRTIIALGLVVWSVMTALSGVAQNFVQLAVARIGVGVGEAAGSPPAHSLISDYFPPEKRATALSIYNMGISGGIMLGFIIGGWMVQLYGWRSAFFVVGFPGIVLALVVRFTIHEPPRGMSDGEDADTESYTMGEVARFLWSMRSFKFLALGTGMSAFASYGFDVWAAPFLGRVHEMESGAIGTWLGVMSGLAGIGFLIGGIWSDRWGRKDPRAYLWVSAISTLASMPFILLFLLTPSRVPALLAYFPAVAFWNMYLGPVIAISHQLVKPRMRALTSAIVFFILNIVGLGLGPLLVGSLNDLLNPRFGDTAIRYSLVLSTSANVISAALFLVAAKYLRADLAAAKDRGRQD